jgi:DNA processing protein
MFAASAREVSEVEGLDATVAARIEQVRREYDAEADAQELERRGFRVLSLYDPSYPATLKTIEDPPPVLFLRGTLTPAEDQAVAVVGSRRSSSYGRLVAEDLSRKLVPYGLTIVSGLAQGIDTAAHQGALRAGGRTIAVLGCGLDVCYPRENRALADAIAEQGALLTEFPLGTPPEGWHFPARNRIISGLSRAVVVIEAPINSGALITADYALEQGREVLAVPGNVTNNRSAGCHRLIKEGARLVEDVFDIVDVLGLSAPLRLPVPSETPPAPSLQPDEQRIIEVLGIHQKHVDQIIREASLSTAQVNSALVLLELKGLVRRLPGNLFVRSS